MIYPVDSVIQPLNNRGLQLNYVLGDRGEDIEKQGKKQARNNAISPEWTERREHRHQGSYGWESFRAKPNCGTQFDEKENEKNTEHKVS